MFKEIFSRMIQLISQPAKAWTELAEKEETNEQFLSRFIYPLAGLVAITAFLGILVTRKEFNTEVALKASIIDLVAVLGGFFLSAYILNELWHSVFKREKNLELWQRFVGYSSVLMYALKIVLSLLPEFFFLNFFVFYTLYMVWEGANPFMHVEEKERLKFVAITTAVVLIIPVVIIKILVIFMPGLRV